jgi:hypothetical protein
MGLARHCFSKEISKTVATPLPGEWRLDKT